MKFKKILRWVYVFVLAWLTGRILWIRWVEHRIPTQVSAITVYFFVAFSVGLIVFLVRSNFRKSLQVP